MKKIMAVIFGGRTCEHDVSIITGHQILENADRNKYTLVPVYISRDGHWYTGEKLADIDFFKHFDKEAVTQVYLEPNDGAAALYACKPNGMFQNKRKPITSLDAVIPAMHGMNGEDGTLQGLLELCNIPFTSSGVVGSAVGMDKIAMRLLFKGAGLPVLPSLYFERSGWTKRRDAILDEMEKEVGYPLFVKPANLGSSIGISRADNREALQRAMDVAFHYDRRVLVEKAIRCQEINCSGLGYGDKVQASVCEQPVSWDQFLTFDEKYMRGGGKGMKSMGRIIPAPIDDEMTKTIQAMTETIFRVLDCKGVVRIDYMIDQDTQTLYVNEINTIPGSFAFYLWEPQGLSFTQLIDAMVECAEAAHWEKNANEYAYDSQLLHKVKKGSKMGK